MTHQVPLKPTPLHPQYGHSQPSLLFHSAMAHRFKEKNTSSGKRKLGGEKRTKTNKQTNKHRVEWDTASPLHTLMHILRDVLIKGIYLFYIISICYEPLMVITQKSNVHLKLLYKTRNAMPLVYGLAGTEKALFTWLCVWCVFDVLFYAFEVCHVTLGSIMHLFPTS